MLVTPNLVPEPDPFTLHERMGRVTMTVQPGNSPALTTGKLMTGVGAAGAIFGLVSVSLSYSGAVPAQPSFRTASVGVLVGGVVALAIGIPLVLTMGTKLHLETVGLF
jgi:hypothetical protein